MGPSRCALCETSRILGFGRWLCLEGLEGRHERVEVRNKNVALNEQGDTFLDTHTNVEEAMGKYMINTCTPEGSSVKVH